MTANRARGDVRGAGVTSRHARGRAARVFGPRASTAVRELLDAGRHDAPHRGRGDDPERHARPATVGRAHPRRPRRRAARACRPARSRACPPTPTASSRSTSSARSAGCEAVYAAGDATDFPIKQGGLATQQADAVASAIAARPGAPVTPQPFEPVLRGMLLTEDHPIWLRDEAAAHGEAAVSATRPVVAADQDRGPVARPLPAGTRRTGRGRLPPHRASDRGPARPARVTPLIAHYPRRAETRRPARRHASSGYGRIRRLIQHRLPATSIRVRTVLHVAMLVARSR